MEFRMNAVSIRRRWLIARPWLQDSLAAILMIATAIAILVLMGECADLCTAWGWCA
jgi:hypothetical protein